VSALASIWTLVRWVHLLSAIAWIGGQLFILLVLLPIMRGALPRDERTILFARVGRRYGVVSWVALTLLIVSGFLNGERRHIAWEHLDASSYGRILAAKLVLVAVVIVVTLVHALYFGRRITQLAERAAALGRDDPEVAAERRRLGMISGILSGLNLLLNLAIVYFAAALVA
jgi:uncharacterized membrane protein